LQRCRTHLLRESKDLAEKFEEAIPLHDGLKELYELPTKALENDYSTRSQKDFVAISSRSSAVLVIKEYSIEKVRKLIGKIDNGFEYWFSRLS
jgi:transposase